METIATVGYGDMAPQTTLGRIVAGITMIMGFAIFGSLTAVITSLVLEPTKDANDPILAKLEKIEAELGEAPESFGGKLTKTGKAKISRKGANIRA
jgi:voltage-gated potassium channel